MPDLTFEEQIAELERRHDEAQDIPMMGYWNTPYEDGPDARCKEVVQHIAPMTNHLVDALVAYMDAGDFCTQYRGFAGCRVCGTTLGTMDMVTPDRKWRFPEKWQHYIQAHGVRPPEAFVEDALRWYEEHP